MSDTLAAETANRFHRDIIAAVDADAPFGWINNYSGQIANDFDDLAIALGTTPRELDAALTTADRFEADDDGFASDWPEDQEEPPTRADILGDWEPASGMDYLTDALSIRYTTTGRNADDYLHAEIAIAIGGPNVWINTGERTLTVYWGGAPETRGLPFSFCDALDDAARELWEMGA